MEESRDVIYGFLILGFFLIVLFTLFFKWWKDYKRTKEIISLGKTKKPIKTILIIIGILIIGFFGYYFLQGYFSDDFLACQWTANTALIKVRGAIVTYGADQIINEDGSITVPDETSSEEMVELIKKLLESEC